MKGKSITPSVEKPSLFDRTYREEQLLFDKISLLDEQYCAAFVNTVFKLDQSYGQIKSQEIEDACDISILINYYSEYLMDNLETILRMRLYYTAKLGILDYLLCFMEKIKGDVFENTCRFFRKDRNEIVRFQAMVNLLYSDIKQKNQVLKILRNQQYPGLFYRFLNSIELFSLSGEHRSLLGEIKPLVHSNKFLSALVQGELIHMIDDTIERIAE